MTRGQAGRLRHIQGIFNEGAAGMPAAPW